MTPAAVHYGRAERIYEHRCQVLAAAYAARPERFVQGEPTPPRWPEEVWINPPHSSHQSADEVGPAASGMEPAPAPPDDTEALLPKFERKLSHNR